ncbi:MAG: hypothetical protein GY841_12240 [FCB group bacterium]|nr:hypothetical protein [FCB group bacterium]
MEFEKMGFDLTMMAWAVMGNAGLITLGAYLVAHLSRVIERWEAGQAAGDAHNTAAPTDNEHDSLPTVTPLRGSRSGEDSQAAVQYLHYSSEIPHVA